MRFLLSALFFLMPSAALALSCMVPNAGDSLNHATENGYRQIVVAGVLLPPENKVVRKGYATVTARYRVVGTQLLPGDRDRHFARGVDLKSSCVLDQWCGPIPDKPIEGVFLMDDKGDLGPLLVVSPCPGAIYSRYGPEQIQALRQCLTAGICGEKELQVLSYRNIR